jgi:hypothetical protein
MLIAKMAATPNTIPKVLNSMRIGRARRERSVNNLDKDNIAFILKS